MACGTHRQTAAQGDWCRENNRNRNIDGASKEMVKFTACGLKVFPPSRGSHIHCLMNDMYYSVCGIVCCEWCSLTQEHSTYDLHSHHSAPNDIHF